MNIDKFEKTEDITNHKKSNLPKIGCKLVFIAEKVGSNIDQKPRLFLLMRF